MEHLLALPRTWELLQLSLGGNFRMLAERIV
jgi:hypothetical protein